MNIQEKDILNKLLEEPFVNQRILAEASGYSLGTVNKSLKTLMTEGYIDEKAEITDKAKKLIRETKPERAVILAAGFGMRMVPINTEYPKGLLEIDGERLIERIIKQLHEVKINEIYVVTGFMKEKYEYLIDKYNVNLVVNPEYAIKNNLHSVKCVVNKLENTYIIPCDIWCRENPFNKNELYSWYMVSDYVDDESTVRINRKMELIKVPDESAGNAMIGISYLTREDGKIIADRIKELCNESRYNNSFWEEALYIKDKMMVSAKTVSSKDVIEINTYEQLREIDENSDQLDTDAISVICEAFKINKNDIYNITVLKKGMTNRSFLFECKGKKYIMRIPGEGTDMLINRREEAEVYNVVNKEKICDNVIYINPDNGYKITEFIENSRVCNPFNEDDVKRCMDKLRTFHNLKLKVNHEFNILGQMKFYESLWNEKSVYDDYELTKANVLSLKKYVDDNVSEKVLTHIDAVPDNFLFAGDEIRLIDWEYAGMQDPHVDIAMFAIYSLYDREQTDRLIDAYFTGNCDKKTRLKIYCYIAMCGLLWSNWCEYKRQLGVEFGEYSLRQYRYAKDFYRIFINESEQIKEELK